MYVILNSSIFYLNCIEYCSFYKYVNFCYSCLAGGYPNPTYEWFKESYENDNLVARKIDPLQDGRITISGGTLIINSPEKVTQIF